MEQIRLIECNNCGEWEESPEDAARHTAQNFEYLGPDGVNGVYKCSCGKTVTSSII